MRNCKSYKGARVVDTLSLNIEDAFLTFKKGKPLDCDVLSTDGISINKNSSTKFLGVRLDKTLNWKNILILYPVNYQEWHLRYLSLQLWWLVIFSLLCITPVHTWVIYNILGMGEWISVELEKAMVQKRKNRISCGSRPPAHVDPFERYLDLLSLLSQTNIYYGVSSFVTIVKPPKVSKYLLWLF